MVYTKLLTVTEACELHSNALDFALSDQVEHLSDLLIDAETKADDFFAKNYVTSGMARLLKECLQRLSGDSSQAVFELRQAMGGGKTHSMLALGILARNPNMYERVPSEVTAGITPFKSKVVAINGRTISKDHYLWGDIADQLGKKEQFSEFWRNGADAPSEKDWINLIGSEATLILLDELPPYLDYATTRPVGGGTLANVTTYALSNLLSAAMKLPKTAIVVSNLTGSYQGATQALAKAIKDISEETERQARSITPVDLNTNEIYEILRKRMFSKLPDQKEIEKTADAYGEAINEAGFCVVTGDGSSMGSLEDKARRIWAIAKVEQELSDNPAHRQELQEEAEQAEFDFNASVQSLFNRVYFPMERSGKAELVHTKLNLAIEHRNDGNEINGEKAVEDALAGSGANKLLLDVKANFDRLIDRAEDVLWPGSQTRVRWKDVVERAQSNTRWLWTPQKGLDDLRDQAVFIGRWSYDPDGYVDKKPPKPRTSINITELSYNEATGESEIELFPQNAGKSPLIRISETADIDKDGNGQPPF